MIFDLVKRFNNLICMEEDGGAGGEPTPAEPTQEPEKTFTQEQVNSMIAAEKRKQVSAAYKSMGFDSEESAKEFIEKYRNQEEAAKTDLEKAQAQVTALEEEKKLQAQTAQDLQYKFDAIELGCPASSASDVVTLAKSKMTDGKDFSEALAEVKEQYPTMFNLPENIETTGSGGTTPRKKLTAGDLTGIGERLAETKAKQRGIKR